MERVVTGYARVQNLKFAEVGAFSDVEQVRHALPDCHLNARYSPVSLKSVGFEEMKDEIGAIMRKGAPLERLSVSCVGIDGDTPDENIRNFLSACREAEAEVNREQEKFA